MKISQDLKNAILKKTWKDENTGRVKIELGNCRLDFKKAYFLNGFTNQGVKLSWVNGEREIKVIGKIEQRHDYYALYTEGWNYIEHIPLSEIEEVK